LENLNEAVFADSVTTSREDLGNSFVCIERVETDRAFDRLEGIVHERMRFGNFNMLDLINLGVFI